jgi:SAM-dependent methyltransferase
MTGFDIDDSVVEACRSQGLNAMHYDGRQLPVSSESFDAVVAWHVIEHVADVRETLTDWYRVLRPGGVMVVDTPDASSPKIKRLGAQYRQFWAAEHTYTFAYGNLSRFAEQAGFEVLADPGLGEIDRLRWIGRGYAYFYHMWSGARRQAGLDKAFSLFARKPVCAAVATPLKRVA